MSQNKVYRKEQKYCHRNKFTVTGRNILTQQEIYFDRKKITVAGRNLQSQKEIYYSILLLKT